jgi:PAS domain S-box-containing protein
MATRAARRATTDGPTMSSLPRVIVGPNGRYVDANDAAAHLFGVRRDEIIGRAVGSFTAHENDDEIGRRPLGLAVRGRRVASTAVVTRPDGEAWPIEVMVRPSGKEGHVVTMRRIAGVNGRGHLGEAD